MARIDKGLDFPHALEEIQTLYGLVGKPTPNTPTLSLSLSSSVRRVFVFNCLPVALKASDHAKIMRRRLPELLVQYMLVQYMLVSICWCSICGAHGCCSDGRVDNVRAHRLEAAARESVA